MTPPSSRLPDPSVRARSRHPLLDRCSAERWIALARTIDGSRGSSGRTSPLARPRRADGRILMRSRLMTLHLDRRYRSAGSCGPASGTAACVRMPVLWSARSPWALKPFTAYRSHPAAKLPGCPGRPGQPTEPIQKASHQAIRFVGPPQRHGWGAPPPDLPSQALSLGVSVEVGDPLPGHRSRPASRRNVVVHRSLPQRRPLRDACLLPAAMVGQGAAPAIDGPTAFLRPADAASTGRWMRTSDQDADMRSCASSPRVCRGAPGRSPAGPTSAPGRNCQSWRSGMSFIIPTFPSASPSFGR